MACSSVPVPVAVAAVFGGAAGLWACACWAGRLVAVVVSGARGRFRLVAYSNVGCCGSPFCFVGCARGLAARLGVVAWAVGAGVGGTECVTLS